MTSIDTLVERLCPLGVEHKPLGEIANLVRGNGMPKTDLVGEGVGAIHYGQIYTRYKTWTESTISFVTADTAARLAKADRGDVIVTNTSENIEDVGKAVAWLGEDQIVTGGHATIVKHNLEPKYLAYWFQSPSFATQKRALATGTKVIDVSARQLERVRLPVPPIEVQREIVRILDTFADLEAGLEAELNAELEARRQQNAHYRESLFATHIGESRALGDVGAFIRGNGLQKRDLTDAGVPAIHYGQIHTSYGAWTSRTKSFTAAATAARLRRARPGDLLIATTSEDDYAVAKATAWVGNSEVVLSGDAYIYQHQLEPKFVSYFFQTEQFQSQKRRHITGTKVRRVSGEALSKIIIPVPPRVEQERIVEVLDAFDALVSDLSVDLLAELTARREQYEHYRDRLLSFKELGA